MTKTILQIPMNIDLRNKAEKEAHEQGFSSLQELVRVFLQRLSLKQLQVTFEEPIYLSEKASKRYEKIDEDFKKGKNIDEAKDVDDLMRQLREDSSS